MADDLQTDIDNSADTSQEDPIYVAGQAPRDRTPGEVATDRTALDQEILREEAEEAKRAKTAQTARDKFNADLDETQRQAKTDSQAGVRTANEQPQGNELFSATGWEKTRRWLGGIKDKGSYLQVGKGKDGRISDKNLRKALAVMVLEKGFDEILIYRGNKIDPEATQRAAQMLKEMQAANHLLAGRSAQILQDAMTELEPWRGYLFGLPLLRPLSHVSNNLSNWNGARKGMKQHLKNERKLVKAETKIAKGLVPKDTERREHITPVSQRTRLADSEASTQGAFKTAAAGESAPQTSKDPAAQPVIGGGTAPI